MTDLNQKKRIIYFFLAAVILIAAIYLVWRIFTGGSAPTEPTGQPPITGGVPGFPPPGVPTPPSGPGGSTSTPPIVTLPPEAQKLLRLTDYSVAGPSLNRDGTAVLFYKKEGGGLYSVDFDAQTTQKLSPITIVGLLDAVWSSGGDRAAVQYLDQDTVKSFLHIGSSTVAVLTPNVRSPSWSPDRKSLAYLITRDGVTNLIVADAAGKNPRTVFANQLRDSSISWITTDKIAFATAPSGRAEGYVFVYARGSGSFAQILGPRFGLTAKWSPDGSKVLASFTNSTGRNLQLALFDSSGRELHRLPLVTIPDKCAWSADSQSIYCAVPHQTPVDVTWPDDYFRGELTSSDRIVDINPATGDIVPIFDEGALSISDLFATRDKSLLFFINRPDGTLWRYKLKE